MRLWSRNAGISRVVEKGPSAPRPTTAAEAQVHHSRQQQPSAQDRRQVTKETPAVIEHPKQKPTETQGLGTGLSGSSWHSGVI